MKSSLIILYLWRYLIVHQSLAVSDLHCGCNAAAKIPKKEKMNNVLPCGKGHVINGN